MTTRSDFMAKALRHSPPSMLASFLAKGEGQALTYNLDANRLTTIVSPNGVRFTFPPFCFSDANGQPVNGEVRFLLREVFGKSQMVLSNLMATSEDRLLESAGQFLLQATQNGKPLQLAEPVTVEMPVIPSLSNKIAVKLFQGSYSTMQAFNDDNIFDWQLVNNRALPIRKVSGKKYFRFDIKAFNWYGCHYFYPKKSARAMVSACAVSAIEAFDDHLAYLVFDDIPSAARMYFNGNRFIALNIPTNLAAQVVLFAMKDEQLYYGARAVENTTSQLVYVEMEPISEYKLLDKIRAL